MFTYIPKPLFINNINAGICVAMRLNVPDFWCFSTAPFQPLENEYVFEGFFATFVPFDVVWEL